MTEPDVTLTDYGLSVLCSWFAWTLKKQPTQIALMRMAWVTFFGSIAVAALTGGQCMAFFLMN